MRRLSHDPTISHFSHHHPLELTPLQQSLAPPTCAGCTFRASGWAYSCTPCGYVLHISCAKLPRRIRHPAHPQHSLTLLAAPAYEEGSFNCDACDRNGTGFSYNCDPCGVDLHGLCAAMPLSVPHHAHSHPLSLVFSCPYEDNGFSCDICRGFGSNHWLYRCAMCEFDAHIGCATAETAQGQPRPPPLQQQAPARGPMVVNNGGWQSGAVRGPQPPLGINRAGSGRGGGGLVNQAIQGFVDGAAQQVGQSVMQNILGGGGGSSGGGGGSSIVDVASAVVGMFAGSDD